MLRCAEVVWLPADALDAPSRGDALANVGAGGCRTSGEPAPAAESARTTGLQLRSLIAA